MRVSKSRGKPRPAQPRVEGLSQTRQCVCPDRVTAVRARGRRQAEPRRALVVTCPAGPVPHVRAGQTAPGRPLNAPPPRPERPDHVQAYDFVQSRLRDGRDVGMLTVICEHTGECLAVGAGRPIRSADVLEVLASLLVVRESGVQ